MANHLRTEPILPQTMTVATSSSCPIQTASGTVTHRLGQQSTAFRKSMARVMEDGICIFAFVKDRAVQAVWPGGVRRLTRH